jgi:hypothetical protein
MPFSRGKILAYTVFLVAVLALLVPVVLVERRPMAILYSLRINVLQL